MSLYFRRKLTVPQEGVDFATILRRKRFKPAFSWIILPAKPKRKTGFGLGKIYILFLLKNCNHFQMTFYYKFV
jgi:hypothetical protein